MSSGGGPDGVSSEEVVEEVGCSEAGSVDLSISPRSAEEWRESSSVPGGWTGSYSEVASWPASWRMIFEPPGWEGRKDVTLVEERQDSWRIY